MVLRLLLLFLPRRLSTEGSVALWAQASCKHGSNHSNAMLA